jgi:hypothetical protein
MWAGSVGLIVAFLVILLLALGLAVVIAAPILAVPFFLVGFAAFLIWRGRARSRGALGERYQRRVPRTEETAADPVADSGVADAARARSDAHTEAV